MIRPLRIAIITAGIALVVLTLSGGAASGPRTPEGPAHLPSPFLGMAAIGGGGVVASIDSFGSIVNLRSPGPAGKPAIHTGLDEQRRSKVPATNGIVVRAAADGGLPVPIWRARSVEQRYVSGSNVLVTEAETGGAAVEIRDAIEPGRPSFAREITARPAAPTPSPEAMAEPKVSLALTARFDFDDAPREVEIDPGRGLLAVHAGEKSVTCKAAPAADITHEGEYFSIEWSSRSELQASLACGLEGEPPPADADSVIAAAVTADREWLGRSEPLGPDSPEWARDLYRRSLLVLRSLVDSTTGASPAGVRDFWHYIWPRDAATVALALSESGHETEARAVARYLSELEAERAARFTSEGLPVEDGRVPQGDSAGWVRLARQAGGLKPEAFEVGEWRELGDYGERRGDTGDYLANAIAAGVPPPQIAAEFRQGDVLVRESMNPESPLDAAAGWAVRPFPRPALFELVRNTLLELVESEAGPYGLRPSSDWPGRDPWTATTASTAWALAGLGEREVALGLAASVRDSTTPLGLLPERVDAGSGRPRSTTPLAWSHALAALMLRELWPQRPGRPEREAR